MCKAYPKTPSQYLFPRVTNPNVQIWVDKFIFDMGSKEEARIEALRDKHDAEMKSKMFEIILKVIKSVLKALAGRR